ncbi:MAG TPA: ATP-dependent DNA helicase RecG [Mycobacteriales bacterium]|nr:ATP-dependent DNA helicase RecG [Mycobacteriales bacterium]
MGVRLEDRVEKAVGGTSARALATLGITTVGDLLRHYPRRYAERGALTPVRDLRDGDHVTVVGEVVSSSVRKARTGKMLAEATVTDGEARLRLTFFGKTATWHADRLQRGRRGLFAGTVSTFNGVRQLTHPEYVLDEEVEGFAGALLPVYPATKQASSWDIAGAVRVALDVVDVDDDPLPEQLLRQRRLLPLREALRSIHRPDSRTDVAAARDRLTWDEAYTLQVVLAQRRAALAQTPATPRPPRGGGLLDAFDARLPFPLTAGQREVGEVLDAELAQAHPMHRLLQGEVGSGKTLVALRAMLRVVDAGGQAALLAPTEVLAQQHARSLRELLGPLAEAGRLGGADTATRIALLTGSLGAAARRESLLDAASGVAGIVVGTHALLEEQVQFADLGLVVVDEQHRFGVEQRDALRAKAGGAPPHVLVMTATPIPRTVAMTVFGDLETSTLSELPRGRSPITTHVVPGGGKAFARTWEKVREEVAAGHQAFVVCPRIGGDDAAEAGADEGRRPAAAVEDVLPLLAGGALGGLRLEALHGRMAPDAKEDVMRRFSRGDVDVLVATTVVEVGVDVPNATVMVVLDADRFGVSQLHQLRGRIGRGSAPGLCVLVTDVEPESPAGERLRAVASTTDGFALSEIDLQQRREGDVLGSTQSGRRSSLRLLELTKHEDLIREARAAATELVAADPDLARHPALRRAVDELVDPERAEYLEKA